MTPIPEPIDIDSAPDPGRGTRQAVFLRSLAAVEADLEAYIATLIVDRADSEDVFQETCVTLWRKFDEFEFGSDFGRWAKGIAYYKARAYWRDRRRRRESALTEEALAKLSGGFTAAQEILEMRAELLRDCVEQLGRGDRGLVERVYSIREPVAAIAASMKKTKWTIYKRLKRIQEKLAACVDRKMR